MDTFAEYTERPWMPFDPGLLDIVRTGSHFTLFSGAAPLLTPYGQTVTLDSERLAWQLLTGLSFPGWKDQQGLSAIRLFGFQKDFIEAGEDPVIDGWSDLVDGDPFVAIKTSGGYHSPVADPEEAIFAFSFSMLSSLISTVNYFISAEMGRTPLDDSEQHPFPVLLRNSYDRLSPGKKAVVNALSCLHGSGIVLPLLFALKVLSPGEYTRGLVALRIMDGGSMQEIMAGLACVCDYLECQDQPADSVQPARVIIREGENDHVEFKSTLRWDIRAGKTNPAVERASLKTIAAFLNSAGGTLLIGVRDDGSMEGIESDKFANDDKFLLHLWTLIRTALGRDVCPWIRTILEKTDDKTVCAVHCRRSSRPVFLRQPGFDEQFFIRVGPSSNAMDISEALKYIGEHFGGK